LRFDSYELLQHTYDPSEAIRSKPTRIRTLPIISDHIYQYSDYFTYFDVPTMHFITIWCASLLRPSISSTKLLRRHPDHSEALFIYILYLKPLPLVIKKKSSPTSIIAVIPLRLHPQATLSVIFCTVTPFYFIISLWHRSPSRTLRYLSAFLAFVSRFIGFSFRKPLQDQSTTPCTHFRFLLVCVVSLWFSDHRDTADTSVLDISIFD
jgi:hypothetical protein